MNAFLLLPLVITFILFPLAGAAALRIPRKEPRNWAFLAVNAAGAFSLCAVTAARGVHFHQAKQFAAVSLLFLGLYLALVLAHFAMVRMAGVRPGAASTLALLYPIALLVLLKYVPQQYDPLNRLLAPFGKTVPVLLVGISYMAFRLNSLAVEVRNGVVAPPTLSEYLSFAFFVPTLMVGPINHYSTYIRSYYGRTGAVAIGPPLVRMLVGLTKYVFLASLLDQLGYAGLMLDGHPHGWIDLAIAAPMFLLYLYCNFSGYCDMAIGAAGLLGIEVEENFDHPFAARNLQEFWNRWHMTLSGYLRDVMFAPLSKRLVGVVGPKYAHHAIAAAIVAVFLVIGTWHGVGLRFALYGVCHGVGVAVCHYYTFFLKKRLGKAGYAEYHRNRWIRYAATAVTFGYNSASLFLFANSWPDAAKIFQTLR
jgi:D-alanyl-lipoteichoic acid acyltransferase DltB (MBOAT superfamily)